MDAWLFTALCGLVLLLLIYIVPSVLRHWRDVWREDSQQVDPPPSDEHDGVPDSGGQRLTAAMSGNVMTVAKTAVFESDVNELAKLLMGDMAGKWELFLVLLGVPCGVLDAIKQRHPHSPELCLVRGLEHWVLSMSAPTYEKIVKLLRDETPVVNIPLAHRVEEFARERQEAAAAAAAAPSPEIKKSDENTKKGQTEGEHGGTFMTTAKRPQFPYLKTPGMSGNDRRLLEGRLKRETQLMESHFQKVITSTMQALEAQGCTPNELRSRMLAFQTSEELMTENKPKPFMHCHVEIGNAANLDLAFFPISRYFSFFNYGIIEHIICEFGIDKACLNEYKEKFKEFCLRRVSECPFNALGTQVKGDVPVVFVLDRSFANYTLNALNLFQSDICKILDVTTFELRFLNAYDECVKLVFTFPSCLVGEVFPLSIDKQKLLLIHDVQQVMCNNEVVFARYLHEFLETRKQYSLLKSSLPNIGHAKRKLWCLLQSTKPEKQQHLLLTGQGLLTSCSVTLDFESLNDLVRALEHPYLHPTEEVSYVAEENAVVVVQPFESQGSIKDAIHKSTPALSWPEKYSGPGEPLTRDRIARYGRQILEAMMFLYDQGFPPLNCVHSGNVLLKDGVCKLAGYAVDLLGYETLMHMISKDQKNDVDVIMFGRLLYEMSAGVELESLSPSEKEFKNCHIQEVLRFIFKQDGTYPTLKEVLKTEFFQNEQPLELEDWDPKKIYLTDDMKLVLQEIRKQRVLDTQSGLPEELSAEVKQLFEEAMAEDGAIDLRIITVLLLGTAGSGKTHFKHLLIDAPPPPFRHSTPLTEAPIRAVSVCMAASEAADGKVKWRKITSEELDSIIADEVCLSKSKTTSTALSQSTEKMETPDKPEIVSNLPDEAKSDQQTLGTKPKFAMVNDEPNAKPVAGSTSASDSVKPQSEELFEADCDDIRDLELESDILKLMGEQHQSWKKLSSRDWVFIIDSGGQPQYLKMIAPFVKHVSACTFVLKLNEGLDDHPEVAFYTSGKLDYPTYKSSLTNKEILKQCCQVIKCKINFEESDTMLMVVGTHQDREDSCQESREEKNKTILQDALAGADNVVLYQPGSPDQVIFPVNCKLPGMEDKVVAAAFRKFVTQSCSLKRRLIPLKWFVLEHLIRQYADQKCVKVVATQVCIQIGRHHLKMNQKAVLGALEFLTAHNLLLSYQHILPGVVFSDVQVLLNLLSEIVQFMEMLRSGSGPIDAKIVRFRDRGILTSEILERFSEHYKDGVFTPEDVLKLFKALLIIADLSHGEYFMPVLLRDLPQDKVNAHRSQCSVVVYSPDGWLPCGLFTSIVAFLINSGGFELYGNVAYRNCVELSLPDGFPGKVTLIDSYKHFEAHLDVPEYDLKKTVCKMLSSKFKEGIDEAAQTHGFRNLRHELGFLCSCTGQPHLATVSPDQQYWKCPVGGGKLTDVQLLWLDRDAPICKFEAAAAGGVGPDGSQQSRLVSSTSTPGQSDELHTTQGWLYKRGKGVRSWKLRWFELGVIKNKLSYFDSNKADRNIRGVISLKEILSVEEAESQVVPSLKSGEVGFFFNVVTQSRVYHLMVLRKTERTEWIQKLQAVLESPIYDSEQEDIIHVSSGDLAVLMELLSEEAGRWELFLGQLGVSEGVRGQIKLEHAGKPQFAKLCLQSGLDHWLRSDPRPTYQRLSAVLRGSTVTNRPLALAVERLAAQHMQGVGDVSVEEMKPWKHALQELRPTLAEAIDAKSSPDRFGDELVEKNFITEQAKRNRVNVEGVANYTKVSYLLDAVSTDIKHADNEDERFKDFTEILRNLGLWDTERKLTECYYAQTTAVEDELPYPWVERLHATSKQVYYYNPVTEKSVWTRPKPDPVSEVLATERDTAAGACAVENRETNLGRDDAVLLEHSGAARQPEAEGINPEALLEKFRARNFRGPKQDVLLELVGAKIPSHWERFGLGVGIEQEDLNAIKGEHGGKNEFYMRCFSTVFDKWENAESSPYTWVKVAEVMVMKIGVVKKANKLYDALEKEGY